MKESKMREPSKTPKLLFTIGQMILLAVGAASSAAIFTALFFANDWFSSSFQSFGCDALDGPTISGWAVYSRTVIASNQEWRSWYNTEEILGSKTVKVTSQPQRSRQTALLRGHDQQDDSASNTTSHQNEKDYSRKVVWLASFPNSGTSFTLHLTREATNCSTASNYALEGEIRDKPGVPAIPTTGGSNGPWLEVIPNRTTCLPNYILTKTHCGGFCSYCPPEKYIETPRSFQTACQSGTKAFVEQNGEIKKKSVTYDSNQVKKAIHLFRNPLDNIVARFNLDRRRQADPASIDEKKYLWPEIFPGDANGFDQWCSFNDKFVDGLLPLHWIDDRLRRALDGVPCKAEFFRYIQWHNNAFAMLSEMGIPSLIVHYNDYQNNFGATVDGILAFLELPHTGGRVEFESGKVYSDYYTSVQKRAIWGFIEEFSTKETWGQLQNYRHGVDERQEISHSVA